LGSVSFGHHIPNKKEEATMEIIIERGCSLDVHKETVVGCIMGTGIKKEVRTYRAMTNDLLRLKGWFHEAGVTHVAMESTGVYWKPVFNILEELILLKRRAHSPPWNRPNA
jgi:hypothetical protein